MNATLSTPRRRTTAQNGQSEQNLTGSFDSCTAAIESEQPSYCMPADVCNPTKQANAWAPGQASVNNLSWQLFIALNWPADPDNPGTPTVAKSLGALDDSGTGHAKVVWLDYPTPEERSASPRPATRPDPDHSTAKCFDAFLSKRHPLRGARRRRSAAAAGAGSIRTRRSSTPTSA